MANWFGNSDMMDSMLMGIGSGIWESQFTNLQQYQNKQAMQQYLYEEERQEQREREQENIRQCEKLISMSKIMLPPPVAIRYNDTDWLQEQRDKQKTKEKLD